jgi:arylsulfatase A-like enzyme
MSQYSRRSFIEKMAAAGLAIPTGQWQPAKQPNILWIMADDHSREAISCYGSRMNQTPNIDRIGREGMRLQEAFCTNAICTPSRASILTGQYSQKNGIYTLDDRFAPGQRTFAGALQEAGYYTGLVGKLHVTQNPAGFNYWNIFPEQGTYFDPVMIENGRIYQHSGYVTDIVTDLGLRFLEARPKNKPFCLLLHHKAPHDTWLSDQKHAAMYQEWIAEPPTLYDDYKTRSDALRTAENKIGQRQTVFADETAHIPESERKATCYQIFIQRYLRCVASIDDNVGRVLNYLDKNGLSNDTIVVYTSDHGVFLGDHGLFDKRFMYESAIHIPFLVRYPREIPGSSVNDDFVVNIDFAETLLDFGSAKALPGSQGKSLRRLLRGETVRDWREALYYRYWMHRAHFNIPAHLGIRTRDFKLIYFYGEPCGMNGAIATPSELAWEFYDLKEDPNELKNLIGDPGRQNTIRELRAELKGLQQEYGDLDSCGVFAV